MPSERFLHGELRHPGELDWAVELAGGPDGMACEHLLVVTRDGASWRRLLLEHVGLEEGTSGFSVVWSKDARALGIDFGHRKRITKAATLSEFGFVRELRLIRHRCHWSDEDTHFVCAHLTEPEEWEPQVPDQALTPDSSGFVVSMRFPVTDTASAFERALESELILAVRRVPHAKLAHFGGTVVVRERRVGPEAPNLLYHSRSWHGPYPTDILAWIQQEQRFPDERVLPVWGKPYESGFS